MKKQIKDGKDPLEREKARLKTIKQWSVPLACEKLSAKQQDQDYNAGEWTGFAPRRQLHLIPVHQCINLNPWFEGCNQHHIMTGVVINIPVDLHKSVWHKMTNDDKKDKI